MEDFHFKYTVLSASMAYEVFLRPWLLTSVVIFVGGETVEQQALSGCWYPDVQHSPWHEGHPEWWVLSGKFSSSSVLCENSVAQVKVKLQREVLAHCIICSCFGLQDWWDFINSVFRKWLWFDCSSKQWKIQCIYYWLAKISFDKHTQKITLEMVQMHFMILCGW